MNTIKQLIEKYCPDGVEYKKLGEIADCYSGATPNTKNREYWENGNIPWMSSGEVNLTKVYDTEKKITQLGFDSCSTKMVPADTVVIALAGQGKTRGTVALTKIPLCTNQSLCSIVLRGTLESSFLFHYLRGQYETLRRISSGDGTRGGLNLKMINSFEVPAPPMEVQREIVRILDNFTSLEAELEKQLEAELEARRKQYEYYRDQLLSFKHLTGGGSNEVEWKTLGEVFIMKAGIHINANEINASQTTAYQYPCYGGNGIRGYVKRSNQIGSSAIIGRQGALCGNVKYVDKLYYATEHAVVVKPKEEVDMKWAFYKLQQMNLNQYRSQGAQPGLAVGKLEELKIPVPPLSVQHRIVSILDRFESLVNDISSGLPAEIAARHQQYKYYRDQLLTFKRK